MKRFLAVAVFVTVAVLGANVHAQQETGGQGTGFYIGGHLGLNILSDSEINGGTISTDNGSGLGLGGVLGYDFGMVRLDGEIVLRGNTTDSVGDIPLETAGFSFLGSGDSGDSLTYAFSYMVNGYFDLPTGGPLSFYIGGGIGYATVSVEWDTPGWFPLSIVHVADDSDTGLAYQFSGGIGYEINPRFTVTFGYRYFATEEMQMEFASGSPFGSGPFTMEYQSHEFNVGVRILFN